jgi:trk system potassium uptake protein TrkH
MKRYIRRYLHPMQVVILSFALVILIGTALLSLPFATRSGERMPLLDAFFTATSATCVTGLVVVDTGTTFSTFGQLVILACIQVGGLGLMTLTTVFVVLAGRRVAIADRIAVQESFHHTPTGNIRTLVKYIIIATFAVEATGAALLTFHWTTQGRFGSFGETVYSAVFHSVSAFCNAGFSLHADSLVGYQNDSS